MCNRFKPAEPKALQQEADLGEVDPGIGRIDSVSPLGLGAFITPTGEIEVGQWGMIPPHSKTRIPYTRAGERMSTNNARRETIATSWTFSPAWKAGQRCIVPVRHWVEPYWGLKTRNIWWKFSRSDGHVAGLAGLYSHWKDPMTGELVPSFTLITQNCDLCGHHAGIDRDQRVSVGRVLQCTASPYPTDVSDEEWSFAAPYLTLMDQNAPQREHDLLEVFNALRWLDAGCFEAMVGPALHRARGTRPSGSAERLCDGRTHIAVDL